MTAETEIRARSCGRTLRYVSAFFIALTIFFSDVSADVLTRSRFSSLEP